MNGNVSRVCLFKIGSGDGPPKVVGKMADQELIDQVDGPEDIVDDQQEDGVVVMPADQQCVDAEDTVEYAA
jgi:hypothetical protein